MTHTRRVIWIVFAYFLSFSSWLFAEEGILVIHVVDTQNKPIGGVRLTTRGDGSISPPTDRVGKTRIKLALQTLPNSEVSLQIAKALKDMVFISPWDGRVRVSPFENESQNYVSIVLAERGSRELLINPKALASLAAKINTENAPQTSQQQDLTAEQRRAVLEEQAKIFGLNPDESIGPCVTGVTKQGTHMRKDWPRFMRETIQKQSVNYRNRCASERVS